MHLYNFHINFNIDMTLRDINIKTNVMHQDKLTHHNYPNTNFIYLYIINEILL
jgi:hypothetical protein